MIIVKHKLSLIFVLLTGLFVLTPTKYHSIAATRLTNPIIDFSESQNSELSTGEMINIPAGEFQMGCDVNIPYDLCQEVQLPLHKVYLSEYFIDKFELTNGQYKECEASGACNPPVSITSYTPNFYYGNPVFTDYPAIHITWYDAFAYCSWAGKRLPTEAEL